MEQFDTFVYDVKETNGNTFTIVVGASGRDRIRNWLEFDDGIESYNEMGVTME